MLIRKNYASTDFLRDRGESLGEEDQLTLVDLLVDQIEFADVVLLNKVDAASPAELDAARKIIKALNLVAALIETRFSRVALDQVLDTVMVNKTWTVH